MDEMTCTLTKLDLRPGDTLVVSYPQNTPMVEVARLEKRVKDVVPSGIPVLLVSNVVSFTVISK